jgi:hypothetical protein
MSSGANFPGGRSFYDPYAPGPSGSQSYSGHNLDEARQLHLTTVIDSLTRAGRISAPYSQEAIQEIADFSHIDPAAIKNFLSTQQGFSASQPVIPEEPSQSRSFTPDIDIDIDYSPVIPDRSANMLQPPSHRATPSNASGISYYSDASSNFNLNIPERRRRTPSSRPSTRRSDRSSLSATSGGLGVSSPNSGGYPRRSTSMGGRPSGSVSLSAQQSRHSSQPSGGGQSAKSSVPSMGRIERGVEASGGLVDMGDPFEGTSRVRRDRAAGKKGRYEFEQMERAQASTQQAVLNQNMSERTEDVLERTKDPVKTAYKVAKAQNQARGESNPRLKAAAKVASNFFGIRKTAKNIRENIGQFQSASQPNLVPPRGPYPPMPQPPQGFVPPAVSGPSPYQTMGQQPQSSPFGPNPTMGPQGFGPPATPGPSPYWNPQTMGQPGNPPMPQQPRPQGYGSGSSPYRNPSQTIGQPVNPPMPRQPRPENYGSVSSPYLTGTSDEQSSSGQPSQIRRPRKPRDPYNP